MAKCRSRAARAAAAARAGLPAPPGSRRRPRPAEALPAALRGWAKPLGRSGKGPRGASSASLRPGEQGLPCDGDARAALPAPSLASSLPVPSLPRLLAGSAVSPPEGPAAAPLTHTKEAAALPAGLPAPAQRAGWVPLGRAPAARQPLRAPAKPLPRRLARGWQRARLLPCAGPVPAGRQRLLSAWPGAPSVVPQGGLRAPPPPARRGPPPADTAGAGCAPRPRCPLSVSCPRGLPTVPAGLSLPPSGQSPTSAFFPFHFCPPSLLTSVFLHKNPKIRPTPTRGFALPGAQRVRSPGLGTVWVCLPTCPAALPARGSGNTRGRRIQRGQGGSGRTAGSAALCPSVQVGKKKSRESITWRLPPVDLPFSFPFAVFYRQPKLLSHFIKRGWEGYRKVGTRVPWHTVLLARDL